MIIRAEISTSDQSWVAGLTVLDGRLFQSVALSSVVSIQLKDTTELTIKSSEKEEKKRDERSKR